MDRTDLESDLNREQMSRQWNAGERCFAPCSVSGNLCEARILSIEEDEDGEQVAVVSFLGAEKRRLHLTKLCQFRATKDPWKSLIFDDEDLEKPYFRDRNPLGHATAFKLSEDGDCIPYTINRYLRDYQREGAQFLYRHFDQGRGCILGDDMGLGKTIQVIAFMSAVLHKKGTREDIENNMPEFLLRSMNKQSVASRKMFLIVTPLSVLFNWKDELDAWGYFRVAVLHGNKKDSELSRVKQGKYEISLTTYETLRLCLDEFNSIDWSAVIVDEAHRIKNPKAQVTQIMKSLKCKVRIGLTGTILQNNMEELWCVMDWAVPGCLGSRSRFKQKFSGPVEYGQRYTATKRELATGRKAMQRLARNMSSLFLRRTKDIISNQLPKKEDRIVYCSLTDFQMAVYQTVLNTEDMSLILHAREPCSCNNGRKRKNCCYKVNKYGDPVRTLYFSYLAILRKVANHAALLQIDNTTSKKQETHIERICSEVFSKFPDFVQQSKDAAFETISDPKYSGKMKVLQQLLNHCKKKKDKVLLFSFSTKLLDILERYCMASGLEHRRLDGNTKAEERVKIVKEFNSVQDVNICLVSTMAGGLGLNFVGANVVVVFDPTWNPANDLQAIDRAYRIGQSRDVKVLRLISLGTIEEIIYLRQVYKQQLHCAVVGSENAKRYFAAVQGSKEHQGELFGVRNLFRLKTEGTCLTREILEREGQVEAGIMTATTQLKQRSPEQKLEMEPFDEDYIAHLEHGRQLEKEPFDLSSDNDEETVGSSKIKTLKSRASDTIDAKRQLTLQQCGFSKLLEKKTAAFTKSRGSSDLSDNKSSDSGSASHRSDDERWDKQKISSSLGNQTNTTYPKHDEQDTHGIKQHASNWILSSDSEEANDVNKSEQQKVADVMETKENSDDSDIVYSYEMPVQQKRVLAEEVDKYKTSSYESESSDSEKCNDTSVSSDSFKASEQPEFIKSSSVFRSTKIRAWNNAQKVISAKGTDDISDESDDIKIPTESRSKKLNIMTRKYKRKQVKVNEGDRESNSQTIDVFSSSEGDLPSEKIWDGKKDQKLKSHRNKIKIESTSARYLSHVPIHKEENVGSLDKILDGVEEVAYIHSNQNVVGSSKAENHMSRWAVRDVFELKQFSQLPANVTICCGKKSEDSLEEDTVVKGKESRNDCQQFHVYIEHPIIQREKKVLQAGQTTFLIGRTPKGIIRTQFNEMISYFNKASVQDLAAHVLKSTSEDRQKMLKDFYAAKHPELEEIFPIQAAVLHTGRCEEGEVSKTKQRRRKLRVRERPIKYVADGVDEEFFPNRHKKKASQFQNDSYTDGVCLKEKGKNFSSGTILGSDTRKSNQVSEVCTSDSICSSKLERIAESAVGIINESQQGNTESQFQSRDSLSKAENSIASLLGDTSVLSDLFKSNSKNRTELPRRSHFLLPAEKAKKRPKDIWDILSESNDESLDKLTDLAEVERVCERASGSASRRKEEWDHSLWKKNENFLWQKYNTQDDFSTI
uniref:DNA excision repair protein ERCC-6-like 2 isoform X2 n=1 Tax=Geotrypetes seraphini TaxID=260995 RepID=A0A6P8QA60_GEOSA|nr:DNA excision repair protein ERCC-6-like 2 isoform X2 [Geotrypetes seraphini]